MRVMRRHGGIPVPVVVLLVFLVAGGALAYWLVRHSGDRTPQTPALSQEAVDYLPSLALSDVQMEGAENFLAQTAATISGKLTNNGPRTLRLVEINCIFRDLNGQPLKRERAIVVGRRGGPVKPGETRGFELHFDQVPTNWNQDLPALVIAQILFEEAPGT
jgi:hypothetical protein